MKQKYLPSFLYMVKQKRTKLRKIALAGNRTRASRVAGENSTTEPPVLSVHVQNNNGTTKAGEFNKVLVTYFFRQRASRQKPLYCLLSSVERIFTLSLTKPYIKIVNFPYFAGINSKGSKVDKNTHAQRVQIRRVLYINGAW